MARTNIPRDVRERAIAEKWMTQAQLDWVDANLYNYFVPDWSEDSWEETKETLMAVLDFMPRGDAPAGATSEGE